MTDWSPWIAAIILLLAAAMLVASWLIVPARIGTRVRPAEPTREQLPSPDRPPRAEDLKRK
jgi:hypothetical protein